jgi:hypothetical protein
MSNSLAFATVTASISQILHEAVNREMSGAEVKTVRPDVMGNQGQSQTQKGINIFLYQISPNASLRNIAMPTRRTDGTLVQRSQNAYNLHYLLSFFGDETKLEPQRLLGIAVNAIDSQPMLTRDIIQSAMESAPVEDLADSNLADQAELVKLSPISLNLEELSKLWSVFFQTPYSLSVAYQGSVVLLQTDDMPQKALPIRRRSAEGKTFQQPVIESVTGSGGIDEPIVLGATIVIIGTRLIGEITKVLINGVEVKELIEISNDKIVFELKPEMFPPDFLRAGVLGIQVSHDVGVESKVVPFVLRPTIVGDPVISTVGPNSTTPQPNQPADQGAAGTTAQGKPKKKK